MANNVKFKAPALPIPPTQYNQSLFQRTFSVLRLYFNQLDEHLRQDLGDTTINGDLTVTGGVTATTLTGTLQTAAQTNITSVGALDGGSITSNFGTINIGSSNLTAGYFTMGSSSEFAPNNVINGGLTINNFNSNDNLELVDTNSSNADSDPRVSFYRNSSSPADNDHAGRIEFYANNDAAQKTSTASILNKILDVTDGTEDGELSFSVMQAGTFNTLLTLDPDGVTATGATTVNGAFTANNQYSQFTSSTISSYKYGPIVELFANSTDATTEGGAVVFTGLNEDGRKVSYGSFFVSRSNLSDDGEQKASLVFTVADGSGAVDPFTDYTDDSFKTGHSIALNINADYFITTGYLKSSTGELQLGARQAIKESALQGDAGQSTYDLHMPESRRAKVMQIGGIGPFDGLINTNQSVAQMIQYRGQNMVIASGGALEFELPACAASSDISATTCNIGDIFQISNAVGGSLTIDRDGSGTAQTIYYFPSLTLTPFTNNPTLAVGGTMMLQAVAANTWMVFNDSGLSDA